MSKVLLSKSIFNMLKNHLTAIKIQKDELLGKLYPDSTNERDAFDDLISEYTRKIGEYISHVKLTETESKTCPFVIIGSIVEIEDLEYKETEKYQVVIPYEDRSESDVDFASCLSPMGRALLLKKVNDEVMVETPMGQFSYIIKSIEIPEELFSAASSF